MAPIRRNHIDTLLPAAPVRAAMVVCTLAVTLCSFTQTASAQSTANENTALRGTVEDDGRTLSERRRFLRAAERVNEEVEDEEPETVAEEAEIETEVLTGAVPPVQTSQTVNPRRTTVDSINRQDDPDPFDPVGIRVGTFVLRPSITQQIAHENQHIGGAKLSRTFSRTQFNGELESDWSRHQLTINGEHVLDNTLRGTGAENPSTSVNGALRLDLSSVTTANFTLGYQYGQENQTDANAVDNAVAQSELHLYNASASVSRIFGSWRGTAGISGGRSTYGPVELTNGTELSQAERDANNYTVTLRAGVDIGAAYLPFVEAEFGQILYDEPMDASGFARSSQTYGLRTGIAADFGEKYKGEISAGYVQRNIDDTRLAPIQAFTLDSAATWSPRRGTDVVMGLSTSLSDSTTANEPGSVYYAATAEISHELSANLVANASGVVGWRDYVGTTPNQIVYGAGAGFTWWLSRYFGIDGDVSFDRTVTDGGDTDDELSIGIGIKIQR